MNALNRLKQLLGLPEDAAEETLQAELDKLCVVDRYPSDSIVSSSHGYDLHIDNKIANKSQKIKLSF